MTTRSAYPLDTNHDESVLTQLQVTEAILSGKVSVFEDKATATTTMGCLELDIAVSELDRLYVKLPRLVLLVRAAVQHPCNSDVVADAVRLAEELHTSNGTLTIQRTIGNVMQRARIEPTMLSSVPVPTSLHFNSDPDFVFATRYLIFRTLLAGLIQTICGINPVSNAFDLAAVEAEDVWIGTSILQCVQWAFATDPLTTLRMLIPLQLGFGVWQRLGKRQISSATAEYEQAKRMQAATLELAKKIDGIWESNTSPQRIWRICEMFAGGPYYDWMHKPRSPAGHAVRWENVGEGDTP